MSQVTYLQLSPEFGGTRFGPFHGVEIRLGSDPEMNDITLPANLGVAPQHVKVLQQSETTFIVAPIDRTATVYIWRKNSNKPKQIVTPMAVTPGDGFSLVVPEGARFTIEVGVLAQVREDVGDGFAEKAMKRMPSSRGILDEIKRRGFAAVFTTKLGNTFMNVWRFVSTGQIFSPLYIVAGLMMVSGWIFAGGAGCSALSLNWSKNDFADKWRTCEDMRAELDESDGGTPSVPKLTKYILRDESWRTTLIDDRALAPAYNRKLARKMSDIKQYKWTYKTNRNEFANFHRNLNVPDGLKTTLGYTAAYPSARGYKEWAIIEDAEGEEVCARGPLRLTYRQAVRLGLENVQLDALVSRSIAQNQDREQKVGFLRKTAEFEGQDEDINLDGMKIAEAGGADMQGGRECMHFEGPDDRTEIGPLVKAITRHLGANARGMPPEGAQYWIGHRLAKLAAMDFAYGYEDLKFNSTNLGPIANLENQNVTQKRVAFATDFVAEVMTNAVAARCQAVLDKEMIDSPPEHMDTLPSLVNCAMVKAFVDYGRL